jgi:hypothetical protein
MCYISKCSARSLVFFQVNHFLSKQVQSIAISTRKWPSFYSSWLVLGWRSAWTNYLKNNIFLFRILLLIFYWFQSTITCPASIKFSLYNSILKSSNFKQKHVFLRYSVIFGVFYQFSGSDYAVKTWPNLDIL